MFMEKTININRPFDNELPSEYAQRIGKYYSNRHNKERKKDFGQYMTPLEISRFMSEQFIINKTKLKLLEPGMGSGVLACSLCEYIAQKNKKVESIELICFEIDKNIIHLIKKVLNYLKKWLLDKEINFDYSLIIDDFILYNKYVYANELDLFSDNKKENFENHFDLVISNPPYFKIAKDDIRATALKNIVNGQPNIYALFMAVCARLLSHKGQMVFIVPRSFTSGCYFKVFRNNFLSEVDLAFFHIFHSRTEAFKKDDVLQENIIFKAIKKTPDKKNKFVTISSSNGVNDLNKSQIEKLAFNKIVDLDSADKIIYLPLNKKDDKIFEFVNSWSKSIEKLGLSISTGPVVSFRSLDFLQKQQNSDSETVPLLWINNVKCMDIEWPLNGNNKKQQYIIINENSKKLLLKNTNYVFLRRFSPKEEKRRLTAAPFQKNYFNYDYLGLENHINYIYRKNKELTKEEIYGLSALLNSYIINRYFSLFNGNTQVGAMDTKKIPLPDIETIIEIGRQIIKHKSFEIDDIVNEILEFVD